MKVTSARTRHDAHAFYQRLGFTDVCSNPSDSSKSLADDFCVNTIDHTHLFVMKVIVRLQVRALCASIT